MDIEAVFFRWLLILFRALCILGPLYFVFWIWKPKWIQKFRIPQIKEEPIRSSQDIPYTILGLSVYIIPLFAIVYAKENFGYTKFYTNIDQYGIPYLFFSGFLFIFILDTFFFWVHYLLFHKGSSLRSRHAVHHRTINVTPAAGYSFDLVESLTHMLPFTVMVFVIPLHPIVLTTLSLYGIFNAGYLHLGYDSGLNWKRKNPILKWRYTSTHHSLHHQLYNCNYAQYFTFWDKLMKTEVLCLPGDTIDKANFRNDVKKK